jgi:phage repressor protein C with HTH and peptisase S24 domain
MVAWALGNAMESAMDAGEKIRLEREAKGWSQAQLANRVGISQPAIKKIESGEIRQSKFLPKIAQVLEIPLGDLDPSLTGVVMPLAAEAIPAKRILGDRDFPVYASAEGGPGQIIVNNEAVDFMARPAPLIHVRDSYGLLITGTSMEPEYRQGDTALVSPHLPVIADEVYIFYAEKAGEARATIKYLRRAAPDKWLLSQHNPPDGMAKDFVLSRREWQWAHRVIGKYSRR